MELEITVERVFFPSESVENATWFILGTDKGTCKGNMSWRPKENERLKLQGKYSTYQGKQEFKFTEAALNIPDDSRSLLHYVCEMSNGVGASMEAEIWEKHGEDWAEIKEGQATRLTGRIFQNFVEAILRVEDDREKGRIVAELLKIGCSSNMANAAYERWKNETIGVVSSDPYRLTELTNYGFSDVDNSIRLHFGIKDDDPRRIKAAIVYVMKQLTDQGSTVVDWEILNSSILEKLGGFQHLIVSIVAQMFSEGSLISFPADRKVALANDFKNESLIWDFISGGDSW